MTDDPKSRLCESDGRSIRSLWRFGCGYILLLLLPPIGFLIGCVVGLVRGGGGDFVEVTMVGYGIVGAFTGLAVAIALFLLVTVILYAKDG